MIIQPVLYGLLHNSFLQGAGLVGVGAGALAYVKSIPSKLFTKFHNRLHKKIIVSKEGNDTFFMGILEYIYNTKTASIKSTTSIANWNKKIISGMIMSPRDNRYKFKYKNRKIKVYIEFKGDVKSESKDSDLVLHKNEPLSIEFSSYFLKISDIQEFITTNIISHINSTLVQQNNPSIKTYDGDYWAHQCYTDYRALPSLIFNDNLGNDLLEDVQKFLNDYEWYRGRSIPHRRGYLLHGEPGNGKTSLIRAIASTIGYNIAPINLSTVTDTKLMNALATLPHNTIIVFEDIDSMFFNIKNLNSRFQNKTDSKKTKQKDEPDDEKDNVVMGIGLTFSGLLNALDGLTVSKNRIVFMTTNHIEKLDAALIRPGRCDKRICIGNPSKNTISKLYKQFFPDDSEAQCQHFVDQFKDGEHGTSYIQEKLLSIREVTRDAIQQTPKPK